MGVEVSKKRVREECECGKCIERMSSGWSGRLFVPG